ncbi:MAG: hypothetical protein SNJ79_12720 [Sphingomonadaceae bacterium]
MHGTDPQSSIRTDGPPRPRFTFTLGVTGHRRARLPDAQQPFVRARIRSVVEALRSAVMKVAAEGGEWFASDPPVLRVVSALADGADRWVAESAVAAGFALDAILPFDEETYAADWSVGAEREAMRALVLSAEKRLILPGERRHEVEAYAIAGEALVAHSTVLIAVWDGEPGRGWGGTADVVETAVDGGVPVIQIPPEPEKPIRILWPQFEPYAAAPHFAVHAPAREMSPETLAVMLRGVLLPPDEPLERACLAGFYAEREDRRRWRIEYPLLLQLAGVKRMGKDAFLAPPYLAATADAWAPFRADILALAPGNGLALARLEEAYAWADHLANRFAQSFRSGHVLNFSLAALAVLVALSGLLVPEWKLGLVLLELLMIGGIVWNTRAGHVGQWQRRWLDYRALAERLQPFRLLKLVGVATPPRLPSRKRSLGARWTDWYAAAQWRAFATPTLMLDQAMFRTLRDMIIRHQLEPEIAYHRRNAHRMERLDHRLHRFGQLLFAATIAACIAIVVLKSSGHPAYADYAPLFVFLTAGLPALGGAAYALRVHGDYAGSAGRSAETAQELSRIREALEQPDIPVLRASALTEAAARIMLVDLDEFRLTYEQRGLAIPG